MKLNDLIKNVSAAADSTVLSVQAQVTKLPNDVFKSGIENQIKLVTYDIDSKKTGAAAKPLAEPKGRRWYKKDDTGVYTFIRYGVKKIAITDSQVEGSMALNVGPELTNLKKFYENLLKVVATGELDEKIAAAFAEISEERAEAKKKANEEKAKKKLEEEAANKVATETDEEYEEAAAEV